MPGKVYICSKVKRGVRGAAPKHAGANDTTRYVDVTSAQPTTNAYRRAFSPMDMSLSAYGAPDGHTYACFENYWQSLKHFPNRPHAADKAWWRNAPAPHRRLPKVDPTTCLYASDEARFPGQVFDYVESRKTFYVPDYIGTRLSPNFVQAQLEYIRGWVRDGDDVVVKDYDGPRSANPDADRHGAPLIEEVTADLLRDKINDTTFPFGHGYVVAAEILEIPKEAYIA